MPVASPIDEGGADRLDDAVRRRDRVEVLCGDDQRAVGVSKRGRKAAADHAAEHVGITMLVSSSRWGSFSNVTV